MSFFESFSNSLFKAYQFISYASGIVVVILVIIKDFVKRHLNVFLNKKNKTEKIDVEEKIKDEKVNSSITDKKKELENGVEQDIKEMKSKSSAKRTVRKRTSNISKKWKGNNQ